MSSFVADTRASPRIAELTCPPGKLCRAKRETGQSLPEQSVLRTLNDAGLSLKVHPVGVEPTTNSLRGSCSTIELRMDACILLK